MMMKRLLSLVLVALLAVGLVPLVASAENVTLTVAVYERGNTTNTYGTVTDNYWTRWVQSEFGDPNGITVEYVPIPRSEDEAKFNTLMASGTAPDIIFSYNLSMIIGYGKDGGLTPLDELIEAYGPNIKENLAASLPYGTYEGIQYTIPAVRSMTGRYSNYIRKDWLDRMGVELEVNEAGYYHMSVEAFEALLYQAKELDLDETGMEMFPLGVPGAYNSTQAKPLIFAFVDREGVSAEYAAAAPQMLWPGFKEGVRFLNKLYNDNLIDPDFMVDTDTATPSFNALVSTGRMLAFGHDDMYTNGLRALYETNAEADFVALQLDNVHGEQIIPTYAPTGMYVSVPATCKNPDAAVKYLNFLADYDTYRVLAYGLEGIRYEMIDGSPVDIEYTEEEKAGIESYERITCGDMNLLFNGSPLNYATSIIGKTYADAKIIELQEFSRSLSRVGEVPDYYFGGIRTEAEEKYSGFISNPEASLPLLISCPAEEFDAQYDTVISNYLAQGGQEILDQRIALYHELEALKAK